ncbi:uncharacterized protein [Littorina saxatilis]|uniref:uncharacterized protein n=1 Tax=Littorina saxatilis TaxID=31220 RepID=UPI0038B4BDDD
MQQSAVEEDRVAFVYKSSVKEASASDLLFAIERDFVDLEVGQTSQDDVRFLKIVQDNVTINSEGHYEMPLPFRSDNPTLTNNRGAALKRVLGLKRQFERRPEYLRDYQKFMKVILDRGDAEKVPADEIESSTRWYIPHHGVYNPKKPGKIRVVFDCSAQHLGVCLNDLLLQGPDLISSLVGVLCRFRKGPVAFACDIEKMYHQFHVSKPQRDYLRFLWWEDGDLSRSLVDFRMKVHIFGATSSPGCANFGLKQVAKDNAAISPEASAFLQRDFYVDDGLKAESTVERATEVLAKAREICSMGNLRLHKIVSNSKELLSCFPDSEVSSAVSADLAKPGDLPAVERTLGLQWNTDDDTLGFSNDVKDNPSSRRGVLSTVASLYDPLGLLAPFVLLGKLILQEMCRDRLGWDEALPERLVEQWNAWLQGLANVSQFHVPRNYLPPSFGSLVTVELHHFSDASTTGYGQCSYLRFIDNQDQVHCTLVMAKARVTPLRPVTIPRLELQAAVLSVKVARVLQNELDFENVEHFFWSDSEIVLAYLRNESKRFHVFVANRVQQILQFAGASCWNHVVSSENPADLASRGSGIGNLTTSRWILGPEFLWRRHVFTDERYFEIPPNDVEVKICKASKTTEELTTSFEERTRRFSTRSSLLRGLALIVRRCALKKGIVMSNLESLREAERKWIICIQRESLSNPSTGVRNTLSQLNCFKGEDSLLRVGGRSSKSQESFECKHLVVLPRDSHISLLTARSCHLRVAHQGRTSTINEIRASGYWILGMRHVVSTVIRGCVECLRLRGQPHEQMMSDLPEERVEASPPFTYCGVDCFGPFHVKDGRKEVKRYGLIVTCLASRAVHIEALDDMTTDSFINGLRNVSAIRGNIRLIRCDRGTNFVGACNELKTAWKEMDYGVIASRLLAENCEFKFNPPSSSHMGGAWERQIKTVRSVLNGLLRRSGLRLTSSSLRTFLYEAMAIVNSRPLSVESLEAPDSPRPLTPNHVLTMKHSGILPPPGVFEDADLYVRRRWRCAQRLAEEFWQSWRRTYLATLQQRRKWQRPLTNVAVGDVVVLHEPNVCRNDWTLARVLEVFPGTDGMINVDV